MPPIRRIHTYLGVFIAPSLLFFALTGILQLFSLHESHGPYTAPAIFQTLGSVHKDQILPSHKPRDPDAAAPHPADADQGAKHAEKRLPVTTYLLKWFFVIMALCLVTSTCMGLYIAFKYARRPLLCWGLLIAGAVIPLLLLFS